MRNKELYNRTILDLSIQKDNATLIGNPTKITRFGIIEFICNCGTPYKKKAYSIMMTSGAFCKKCSTINANTKSKKTFLERYNVECSLQNPVIKEKIKETMIKNYGVIHPLQNNELKEKAKSTTLERFGTEYASQSESFKNNIKHTYIIKYGVENILLSSEIREKIKQTCIERYGVENVAQSQEIQEIAQKNAKKYKEYKMPSGELRKVQGYEPLALEELLKTYREEDIKTDRKDVPRISYKCEDKQRYYFPDIYIPSENKIIEVKSTWTYNCKTDNIELKSDATKAAGYNYEIWIYNNKGNKSIK